MSIGSSLNRILLVEDEPDIQIIAKLALESVGGFEVEICSSGSEALEKAPIFRPDLILMDVMMPSMDGPTTLKNLRQINEIATIPIIFMTAKVQPHEVNQYKKLGALAVIAKPFDPMKLASNIKNIWKDAQ